VRLRSEASDAQARLDRAAPLVGAANDAVTTQNTAIATIDQNIAVLDAARTDLVRRAQLAELLAADAKDRAALGETIAAHRTTIENADATINQHGEAVAGVARLRSLAASARALNNSMADCLDLEAEAGAASAALAQSRGTAERAASALSPLERQFADLEVRIAAAERILCAASTAYPWSRWRALLLDDPLQHNDIIHTAAFVDVMRNMVELNGYQLIMSSHDRGESDFIARKFDAAGLPCSTILLTAPSDKGVVWVPPEQNQAAARMLRRDASPPSANRA
jgi:hypothetical protein